MGREAGFPSTCFVGAAAEHSSQRHAAPRTLGPRRAFTLLEILLSLAILSVLLGALYGAFDIYARLATAGREQVERARLARAILRDIQRDLYSLVYYDLNSEGAALTDPAAAGGTGGAAAGGVAGAAASGSTSGSSALDPASGEAVTAPASLGLIGDYANLMLYVDRAQHPAEQTAMATLAGTIDWGKVQSVSWFLAEANASGLQGAVGNLVAGGNIYASTESGAQGLVRLAGDRFLLDQADTSLDMQTMAQYAELVAPEVNYLGFRYFDGLQWVDTWDSSLLGGLPRAVEITIGFRSTDQTSSTVTGSPAQSLQPNVASAGVEVVETTYRLVVALPLASPVSQTTSGLLPQTTTP